MQRTRAMHIHEFVRMLGDYSGLQSCNWHH